MRKVQEHANAPLEAGTRRRGKDQASPPSVVCRKPPLPLASDSPWSAQRLQQSPSGTGTTALPTIVSVRRGDPSHGAHEVPCPGGHLSTSSGCVLPTSCQRTDAPTGRPHPVLRDLVVTLRAFGAFSHHLRLHPAFDREGEGGACCCVPPSQRTSSPSSPDEAFECCGSVHRRGSSAHVLSSQSFALRHVPSHGILNIPSGAKVLQGIIPDLGN